MADRSERAARKLKFTLNMLVDAIQECLDAGFEKDEVAHILRIPKDRDVETIDRLLGQ